MQEEYDINLSNVDVSVTVNHEAPKPSVQNHEKAESHGDGDLSDAGVDSINLTHESITSNKNRG